MSFWDYRACRRRLYLHEMTVTDWLRWPFVTINYRYRVARALRFVRSVNRKHPL